MTDDMIAQWKGIFAGAVAHDTRWKRLTPPSDARLRAMASLLYRDRVALESGDHTSCYASLIGAGRKLAPKDWLKVTEHMDEIQAEHDPEHAEWLESHRNSFK